MRVPKFRSLQDFIRFKHSYRFLPVSSRDGLIPCHPMNYGEYSHSSPDTSLVPPEPVFLR